LVVGQGLTGRVSRMSLSDLETIRNSYTINYSFDAFSQQFTATATIDSSNSTICYLSNQLYGDLEADVIECKSCWDAQTAQLVILAQADRECLPRREITYQAAGDTYWLRAGMVGFLTDAPGGISRTRATITAVDRGISPHQISVTLIDRTPVSHA